MNLAVHHQSCPECGGSNRALAKYCRECGKVLALSPLAHLVGLDEIKAYLVGEKAASVAARQMGIRKGAFDSAILLMGNQGTGKTTLGHEITRELHSVGLVKDPAPVLFDANVADTGNGDAINAKFVEAAGGVLFVDNAHCLLLNDGKASLALRKLSSLIENDRSGTIVILAGAAIDLLASASASHDTWSKFASSNRFLLPDFTLEQLVEIAVAKLQKESFIVSDEAREKLADRFRFLMKTPVRTVGGRANAYRAIEEARDIRKEKIRKGPGDLVVRGDDIVGDVEKIPTVDEAMRKLDGLIGMENVKTELRRLLVEASKINDPNARSTIVGHYVLTGNPGTGKTTIARLLGDVLSASGLLHTGHVVEVDRSSLVGAYQGQTTPKVRDAVTRAMGGVLFIDEAYALQKDEHDVFGSEIVDTLVKLMEDNRGKFVLIAAGYPKEMHDFLRTNSGLASRFQKLHIEDYCADDLLKIVKIFAKKDGFSFDAEAESAVRKRLEEMVLRKGNDFGNARDARTLWEEIRREKKSRAGAQDTPLITSEDIPDPSAQRQKVLDGAMASLEAMVGLESVKKRISQLRAGIEANVLRGKVALAAPHMLFLGNAGTGKTVVARLLGDIMFGIGALPTNNVVEVKREDLVAGYGGQTAQKVKDVVTRALGGVLFIDEAYTLAADGLGNEATTTLLALMEQHRGKLSVVAAGYRHEIGMWLQTNQGLKDRFTETVEFPDYSEDECFAIFKVMCERDSMMVADGTEEAVRAYIRAARQAPHFGNARAVRGLFTEACNASGERVFAKQLEDQEEVRRLLSVIEPEDIKTWAMNV